jgi:hypothetical protein
MHDPYTEAERERDEARIYAASLDDKTKGEESVVEYDEVCVDRDEAEEVLEALMRRYHNMRRRFLRDGEAAKRAFGPRRPNEVHDWAHPRNGGRIPGLLPRRRGIDSYHMPARVLEKREQVCKRPDSACVSLCTVSSCSSPPEEGRGV